MKIKNLLSSLTLLAGSSLAGGSLAASIPGDPVYQRSGSFGQSVSLTDSFTVSAPGIYQVTLTDLQNARPFSTSALDVSAGDNPLGSLNGPGSFTFDTRAGELDINFFAEIGKPAVSEDEKKQLVEEARETRGRSWWQSLTTEQKTERKALWSSWTEEQWEEHRDRIHRRNERHVEEHLAHQYTGEYSIEITSGTTVVPVPAAFWLFGSGLLALVGAARRKTAR
mgnify:CR=1 FL=1